MSQLDTLSRKFAAKLGLEPRFGPSESLPHDRPTLESQDNPTMELEDAPTNRLPEKEIEDYSPAISQESLKYHSSPMSSFRFEMHELTFEFHSLKNALSLQNFNESLESIHAMEFMLHQLRERLKLRQESNEEEKKQA